MKKLVLVFALFGSPALAQVQTADEEARALFEQGAAEYASGNFEAAVGTFRRAYLLSNRPGLLYNIGQSELRLGRDGRALSAFEAYLRSDETAMRSEVEERVRVLRELGVTPEEAPPQEGGAPPPPRSSGGSADPAPWIVFGIGLAVAGVGAVLMGLAASEASRVTNAMDGDRWSELEGVANDAQIFWIVGLTLLGAGGAVAVIGLPWGIASGSSGARAELRIAPTGVSIAGSF